MPQIKPELGYYTKSTLACPGGAMSAISFIEDPVPSVCVSDVQTCQPDSPPFIVSTQCFPAPSCTPGCNNGKCVENNKCQCNTGWSGANCDVPVCNPICNPLKGKCASVNNVNQCQCNAGSTGPTCDLPTCTPACAVNGICSSINKCTCRNGWTGAQCTVPPVCYTLKATNPLVCSAHGSCIGLNRCKCRPGFYGLKCQSLHVCWTLKTTNPLACSGNGTCIGTNKCKCKTGFTGVKCEIKPAATTVLEAEDEDEEDELY